MAKASKRNETVVRDYLECYNTGNVDELAEVMADDVYVTGLPGGTEIEGLENYQEWARGVCAALPDLSFEIEDMISQDDRVAAVVNLTGTHEGPLLGIEPTGKTISVEGTLFFDIEDGVITRKRNRSDDLGMLQQLGVVPAEF